MNAPTPDPHRFSLEDWGILVGIVSAVTAALYATWRIVLIPLQQVLAHYILRSELTVLRYNSEAVQTLARQYAELYGGLSEVRVDMERGFAEQKGEARELRDLIIEVLGREPGRRKYDRGHADDDH